MRTRFALLVVLLVAIIAASDFGYASSSGITYHGRILKPDGTPLETSGVQFRLQIRSPGTENCLLYEERQTKSMVGSGGVFSITLNDGSGSRGSADEYASGQRLTLERVFQNKTGYPATLPNCDFGAAYLPNAADGRRFQVSFKDATMADWEPMPAQMINYVPFALEAKSLSGFTPQNLLRVEDGTGPQPANALTPAQFTELEALTLGNSLVYMKTGANGAQAPVRAGNPTSPAAGQFWFDTGTSQLKYYDGSQVQVVGGSGGALPALTSGRIWVGDGANAATAVQMSGDATLSNTGALTLKNTGTAGTYFQVTTDAQGRVTSGSAALTEANIPTLSTAGKVSGTAINTGTIGGNTAINTTGNITSAGLSSNGLWLNGNGNQIRVAASPSLAGNLDFILPPTNGTSGNVLTTNGAGVLSWAAPAASSQWTTSGNNIYYNVASGNVGIGTTTPTTKLHVDGEILGTTKISLGSSQYADLNLMANGTIYQNGGDAFTRIQSTGGGNSRVILQSNGASNSASPAGHEVGRIDFGGYTGATWNDQAGSIKGVADATWNVVSNPLALTFSTTTGTTLSERMRIDSNGRVGIGTTSPTKPLDVNSEIRLFRDTGYPTLYIDAANTNTGQGAIVFRAGRTNNTAFPQAGDWLGQINFRNQNDAQGAMISAVASENQGNAATGTQLRFYTVPNGTLSTYERLRITSDGRIGIGTTSPAVSLDVSGFKDAIRLPAGNNSTERPAAPAIGMLRYNTDDNKLEFHNGSSWQVLSSGGSSTTVSNVSTISNTGGITLTAGAGQSVLVNNGTSSLSPTSGALVVTGGAGISGDTNIGGNIVSNGSISATNAIAATGAANQSSPSIYLSANYWNGSASALDRFSITNILGTGTNPTATLTFDHVAGGTSGSRAYSFLNANVGIGTSTPGGLLDLLKTHNGTTSVGITNYNNTGASARSSYFATNSSGAASFGVFGEAYGTAALANVAAIRASNGLAALNMSTIGAAPITFFTTDTERMRISSDGNVGIGTSSPTAHLQVLAPTGSTSELFRVTANAASGGSAFFIDRYGNATAPGFASSNGPQMTWDTNIPGGAFTSSNATWITSGNGSSTAHNIILKPSGTGNVGIGNTAPTYKLDVTGSIRATNGISATMTDESSGVSVYNFDSTTGRYPGFAVWNFQGSTSGGSPQFKGIGSRGNAGSVLPSQTGDVLASYNGAGSTATGATWGTGDSGGMSVIADQNFAPGASGGALTFNTTLNGQSFTSERMRITNSGRVGIGVSTPQAVLDVASTGTSSAIIVPRADTANRPTPVNGMIRYNTSNNKLEAYENGSWTNMIGSGGGSVAGSNTQIQFNNSGSFGASANLNWDNSNNQLNVGGALNGAIQVNNVSGTLSHTPLYLSQANLADGNTSAIVLGRSSSSNNSGTIAYRPSATAGQNTLELGHYGHSATLAITNGSGTDPGYMGLGILTPTRNLHVHDPSAGNRVDLLLTHAATGTGTGDGLAVYQSGTGAFITNRENGSLRFGTNNLDRMYIAANGEVAIGTTTPLATLHVEKNVDGSNKILVKNTSNGNGADAYAEFENDLGNRFSIGLNSSTYGGVGSDDNGASYIWNVNANPLMFGMNGVEVMRLNPNGNLAIGGRVANEKLVVYGNAVASSFLYSSDERLKTNIEPIEDSLAKLSDLNGVTFDWRKPASANEDRKQMGLIAQEVREKFPEAVVESKDGFLKVNYPALIAPVIQAIKELHAKWTDQSAEIARLKQENEDLKRRLDRIEESLNQRSN